MDLNQLTSATSANPSAESPRPWQITTKPDCDASLRGETVTVPLERSVVCVDIVEKAKTDRLENTVAEMARR
jgi:hypothetical protein